MALPSSPNLIDFGDSPTGQPSLLPLQDPFAAASALTGDPFAVVASSASAPPPPPAAIAPTRNDDMFPSVITTLPAMNSLNPAPPTASTTSIQPMQLHFFVSCSGVDGHSIQPAARSAQNLMRGALSMLAQTSVSKTKSPRGKPPTEVVVEARLTREFVLPGHETAALTTADLPPLLESESYWSERRKSRHPHFAVGFNVECHVAAMRDRHVQIMIMIPEEGANNNKNAQLFGYAQSTFQELYTIATSSDYQQKMTLPVHSTVLDGATVELRFANISPLAPQLFDGYHGIFRSFLFYPPMKEDSDRSQAVAPKLAIEEAVEVDFSVKIPLQLLQVCQFELRQMHDEWRARYNYNRKKNRFFEDDAEALNFGHDIFRVQVVSGRNLSLPSSGGGGGGAAPPGYDTGGAARPSTFSLAGRAGIMSRLKTQAGKWGDAQGGGGSSSHAKTGEGSSSPVNAFVVVKYSDGNGASEQLVGKTNTEYESSSPVFSLNKSPGSCPHGKPSTKLQVSPTLPSRVEVSPVNQLKQFVFYRPSSSSSSSSSSVSDLSGWLKLEVFTESYGIMSGIDHDLIGEVLLPLASVRDAMTVEETIVWEEGGGDGEAETADPDAKRAHAVKALTLVDWFDVRHPSTDELCGQVQLRLQILLSNPAVQSVMELVGDGSDPVLSPRRQRLAADSLPPTSNPLESEMPLAFLYAHVLTLQRQIANVSEMLQLCAHLVEQRKTFKSSQHKKRADIQGIPTNLHVSYFRILRHFGGGGGGDGGGSRRASTEDLLGLHSPRSSSSSSSSAAVVDRRLQAETHATITCGAPTAHAMGLSEYGLREMELEIHRLQNLLDKCNPRVTVASNKELLPSGEFIAEDAAELAFSSLPSDDAATSTGEDDGSSDGGGDAASPSSSPSSSAPSKTKKKGAPKRYAAMASRAVKAASKRKKNSKTATAGSESDDGGGGGGGGEIKYPPLKLEPETADGVDPLTSTAYAVRVLCRLEMLRAEYYLRKSVAVAQSVSSLVACFVAKLDLGLRSTHPEGTLAQLEHVGFLIGWESLISSHGKELRMLSDAWVAIKCLETFAFQLVPSVTSSVTSGVPTKDVVLAKRADIGYTIQVPVTAAQFALLPASLQQGGLISITSVLFTQGINEMQSLANMVGHAGVSIQTKINTSSFRSIVEYYNKLSKATTSVAAVETHVGAHPDEILRHLRGSVESENSASKNTHILFHAADAVRSLNGGRITYCKSGKDRTAMSVTLEQARLLVQRKRHVLEELLEREAGSSAKEHGPLEEVKDVANTLREFGVRIEIAKKNVGRLKYSFNSIQRKLLPEIYRPPMSTVQDLVTSVTARDS